MSSPPLDRRRFLALLGGGALGAVLGCDDAAPPSAQPSGGPSRDPSASGPRTTNPPPRRCPPPRWPGHQPGRVYLGMSYPGPIVAAERRSGPLGVHRSYFGWNDGADEDVVIANDIEAGRLPWVSFQGPRGADDWLPIAGGAYDDALRARARRYAMHAAPLLVTFHHEPTKHSAEGSDFAAAWLRAHDVMSRETGLANVSFVPILGDWAFNPRNEQERPQEYLPPSVLELLPFLGVDCYQNDSGEGYDTRLARILSWLEDNGVERPMVGLGETGCTDAFGSPSAVQWWRASWAWVESNPDKVGVVSYFNSRRNSKEQVVWPLRESRAKLAAFRSSLRSPLSCRLRPRVAAGEGPDCARES